MRNAITTLKIVAIVFTMLTTPLLSKADEYSDDLEFVACENKMSCLDKSGFLNAIYTVQATFGVINAVCLAFPEPIVTKSIVALNAGLGVASVILKNLPCDEEGELRGENREEVLIEICRLTGGTYNRFLDKCDK